MKKLAIVAVAAVALAGCQEPAASASAPGNPFGYTEEHYKLSNGRTVVCLRYDSGSGSASVGGLSCDWANAK